jgi:hypothetical protein
VESVIGTAKRSVDSTVDAYLGRAAFGISVLAAAGFALAGLWIVLVERFSTIVACFGLAAVLLLVSLGLYAVVVARESSAQRDIEVVEKSIEESGAAFPFDFSAALTVLPMVLPLLRSVRNFLPFLIVAGLVASYFMSQTAATTERGEPDQAQARS